MKPQYYRESGKFDPAALAGMLAVGAPAAAGLGALYGYLADLNPLIYLNGLGIILLAGWLGGVITSRAKAARIRNLATLLVVAFVLGLVAEYASLVAWLYAVLDGSFLATAPDTVWFLMEKLGGENGRVVSLGTVRSSVAGRGGLELSGGVLVAIWIAEAVLLIGWLVKSVNEGMAEELFCEGCGEWIDGGSVSLARAPAASPVELKRELERQDPGSFEAFGRWEGETPRFLLLMVRRCGRCEGTPYLTAASVTCKADENGDVSYEPRTLLQHLVLTPEVHAGFLAAVEKAEAENAADQAAEAAATHGEAAATDGEAAATDGGPAPEPAGEPPTGEGGAA